MTKRQLYKAVIDYFRENMPIAKSELNFDTTFQLLVAVILSAQCTDKRVNIITQTLFRHYPDASTMAKAEVSEIFELIKSCSYPNNKAKYLSEMSKKLVECYGGEVPTSRDELMKLPGIGRKTANVVAAVAYNEPVMPVDTHVFRVSARIGLSENAKTPFDTEQQLTANIPSEFVATAHHWLLLHGRYICKARIPLCAQCGIAHLCSYHAQLSNKSNIQQ